MSMTPEVRWDRVEAALEAVLQAPPEERDAVLLRLAEADPALHREVQSLVAAHQAAGDFLETSASSFASAHLRQEPDELPGSVIGRYRLIRELGRGGMGTVWLAERADGQFEQRVALKLIKRGMDSDEILSRFLRERQILARLEHPNIARLLDGGVSDEGRPYFVMEYVPGIPVTRYCDERKLPLQARLRLFVQVCRAVQYAHRSLVVHRDIKPANVLLTEAGEVKLLDFGVAKLLSPESAEEPPTAEGESARGPMTPEYASPEQLAGKPVTTASDVFQLGILLYQLLTGRRPSRSAEPEQAEQRPRGDLAAITRRAQHPDPEQRYPSAEALAEDVERHLAHRPIRFGAGGWRYHGAKFLRRYRLALGVVALVLLTVVGLTAAYLTRLRAERDRARREAAKAAEQAATLRRVFRGWSPDAADRGKVSAELLLGDAARRARIELANQPELLAATLSMVGDLASGIGQMAAADSLLTQALAIQQTSGTPSRDRAATLTRRGTLLLESGRYAEAEASLRRALELYQQVPGSGRVELVQVQRALAMTLWHTQRLSEAEAVLRGALGSLPDEQTSVETEIASELGYTLFLEAKYAEAVALLRPTLAEQRRIFGALHVSTLSTMRRLASALRGPASLPEAEALDREALVMARALYGPDHRETSATYGSLAVLLERSGNFTAADSFARAAVAQKIRLYGAAGVETALMQRTLGGIRMVLGDRVEAEQLLRRALTSFRQMGPQGNPDEGDVLNRLAYLLAFRGAADADSLYQQARRFEQARPAAGPFFVTDGYEYLAWTARRHGDLPLAERLYRRALSLYETELPRGHPYRAQAEAGLGELLAAAGRKP